MIFSIKIIENGNRGGFMNRTRTTFNDYEYDRRCKKSIKDANRLAYTTENYSTKNLLELFIGNREVIKGIRL